MLLKTSNKSLKILTNLAVYAALAYNLLNDIKVKISALTELLKVWVARRTRFCEKRGTSKLFFFKLACLSWFIIAINFIQIF